MDKTYDFKDFTKIELSNSFQYDIKQADNYSVVISAPQNELDRIDIRQAAECRAQPFLRIAGEAVKAYKEVQ